MVKAVLKEETRTIVRQRGNMVISFSGVECVFNHLASITDLPAFVNGGEKPTATSSPTKQLEARVPSPRQSRLFPGVMV